MVLAYSFQNYSTSISPFLIFLSVLIFLAFLLLYICFYLLPSTIFLHPILPYVIQPLFLSSSFPTYHVIFILFSFLSSHSHSHSILFPISNFPLSLPSSPSPYLLIPSLSLFSSTLHLLHFTVVFVLWPLLWSGCIVITSHSASPGSIPGRASPWLRFFRVFSSTVSKMSGNVGDICLQVSFVHYYHPKTLVLLRTVTVSDHSSSTWPSLNKISVFFCLFPFSNVSFFFLHLAIILDSECQNFRNLGQRNKIISLRKVLKYLK